jgi:hypothetical protein
LPIGIRWIKRGSNRHERVSRVPNGDVNWEGQADIAHCQPDVVYDFVDRLSNDVALCVESIVNLMVLVVSVHDGLLNVGRYLSTGNGEDFGKGVYNRYQYDTEKRRLYEAALQRVINPPSPAKVIPMRRAAAGD